MKASPFCRGDDQERGDRLPARACAVRLTRDSVVGLEGHVDGSSSSRATARALPSDAALPHAGSSLISRGIVGCACSGPIAE